MTSDEAFKQWYETAGKDGVRLDGKDAWDACLEFVKSSQEPIYIVGKGWQVDTIHEGMELFTHPTPAQPVVTQQYYYRVDECKATNPQSPSCICWHDIGTGPLAQQPERQKSFRPKPSVVQQNQCPICKEGELIERVDERLVEIKGYWTRIQMVYNECYECGAEIATGAQSKLNKQAMQKAREAGL